jgi:hypothetical protein
MYARIQTVEQRPTDEDMARIIDMISGHPGFAAMAMLAGQDGGGTAVSLWQTREDAESAAERSTAARGPRPVSLVRDEIYEVETDLAGIAAGEPPVAAFMGEFDGPLSPARVEAARFAGTERIAPALRRVPGLVRTLVLWHPIERSTTVVHLTTSVAALDDVTAAVTSTPLLPSEVPAMLPGPDRVAVHRVAGFREVVVEPRP